MSLALLVKLLLQGSIFLNVFCLGLKAAAGDATCMWRKPGLLARSWLSMNVVMPLIAAVLAVVFDLHRPVKVALLALALSPIPPLLPNRLFKAGATASYAIALLVTSAVLS